jgi:hypothetical protein
MSSQINVKYINICMSNVSVREDLSTPPSANNEK